MRFFTSRVVRGSVPVGVVGLCVAALVAPATALGLAFEVVPSPSANSSTLNAVTILSPSNAWAVGSFDAQSYNHLHREPFTVHWDGQRWTTVPAPGTMFNDDVLAGVAGASAGDVWAVGMHKRSGFSSPATTMALHWDGSAWSEVATPAINSSFYSFTAVTARAANDVWAVGWARLPSSTQPNPLIEHWNGTAWSVVAGPNLTSTSSRLVGVSATSASDAWAVGTSNGLTLTLHWNGNQWSVVQSPNLPPQAPGATAVTTLTSVVAVGPQDAWAAGYRVDTASGSNLPEHTAIMHWNGTQWMFVSTPSPHGHNTLSGLAAVSSTDVWAVGHGWDDMATGVPVESMELLHWNGSVWSAAAPPANVGTGDNLLNGAAALPSTGDVWAVGAAGSGSTLTVRRR